MYVTGASIVLVSLADTAVFCDTVWGLTEISALLIRCFVIIHKSFIQQYDVDKTSSQLTLQSQSLSKSCLKFSLYHTETTLPLYYIDRTVNAVKGNNRCLFREP